METDDLADARGEGTGQLRRGLVTVLAGVRRVPAHVGDQERPQAGSRETRWARRAPRPRPRARLVIGVTPAHRTTVHTSWWVSQARGPTAPSPSCRQRDSPHSCEGVAAYPHEPPRPSIAPWQGRGVEERCKSGLSGRSAPACRLRPAYPRPRQPGRSGSSRVHDRRDSRPRPARRHGPRRRHLRPGRTRRDLRPRRRGHPARRPRSRRTERGRRRRPARERALRGEPTRRVVAFQEIYDYRHAAPLPLSPVMVWFDGGSATSP